MGEGAGVVVLEELRARQEARRDIYCELVGYGLSADAYHLSASLPDGSGAARCMNMALQSTRR